MFAPNKHHLVVIGNGMASARLVEQVLERNRLLYDITVIGEENGGAYNRILLSDVLNGSQRADQVVTHPVSWYEQQGVQLISGVRATAVDRGRKIITLADGREIPYDKLVIATGSRPFVPSIEGIDLPGVFLFRTLDDCARIAEWAGRCRRAVVIGGGLLGLEAARGLLTRGLEVHVVDLSPRLMGMQLDAEGGQVLGQAVERLGVRTHLSKLTSRILAAGHSGVRAVRFSNGAELACDMVVVSAGIRANAGLAEGCGIEVERGILVDDHLQTSDADIYSVGECAEHDGKLYGLVGPVYEQCAVLAEHLTGGPAEYRGSQTMTKLKVVGVHVAALGERDSREGDDVVCYRDPAAGIYKKLIARDGRLAGAMLVGELDGYEQLASLLRSDGALPQRRSDLLFPGKPDAAVSLADLPDEHPICDCNGVSKGQVVAAIHRGHCSVPSVGKCTRAGTGCGSCRKLIKGLIEAVAGQVKADPAESWYVAAVPMDKPTLVAEIRRRGLRSVSAVLRELGSGQDEKSKMGLASLLKSMWNEQYIDERDSRFINDRVHANIQNDGTFSVVPRIYGGVTSPEELIRIGQVASKYSVRMVKLTGGQRIDLLGVKKEDLPAIWKDLGMSSGHAYTKAFRTCKTCVGTDFCRFGTNDAIGLGIAIEKRLQGLETPAKVKMAVSGCPRNCAEATVKDIGVVATEGGDWEVVVGGAAGASVRKADVLCRVKSKDEALRIIGRFMQYYRENGKWLERTYDFVPRIGIERLRELIVEGRDGICERLDRELQASIDAYRDPWQAEAEQSAYSGQFAGPRAVALPVLTA